jgi:hypothetical protein
MSKADTVIARASMGISLSCSGDRYLSSGGLEVDVCDDLGVPIGIVYLEVAWVKFYGRCG